MDYGEMAEKIKQRHRVLVAGGCKMLSWGDECDCTLCLADKLRSRIAALEKLRPALSTAIAELERAIQGKWDGVAYVKNLRDDLITVHDGVCIESE